MNSDKENIFISFLLGFFFGITFFSYLEKRKKRAIDLKKIKNNLDKGFQIDTENLHNDWQHIYYDLDKSYKKIKEDLYETV